MKKYFAFFSMAIVFIFIIFSCTHLAKPSEILGKSEVHIDWGTNPPTHRDMAKHTITGKQPFEWWYFDGHLDSGETFVINFHDPNFASKKPGIIFSLYKADWSKETYVMNFEDGELQASKDDIDIKCPAGYIRRADKETFLVGLNFQGIKVDFTFTTFAPGWIPFGGNDVNIDMVDFFWTVHQGRNIVNGTIIKDGITRHVKGEGYADHNWGRKPPNEIVRSWIWGRIIADDYTIIYSDVDYRNPVFSKSRPLYIAKGKTMLVGSGSPTIQQQLFATHPLLHRHYPRQINIDYAYGGVEAHLCIHFKALVEDVDLLTVSGLNGFSQWFARTFIARPTYFRIIGDYDGTITENGEKTPIKGECLYEVMGFE